MYDVFLRLSSFCCLIAAVSANYRCAQLQNSRNVLDDLKRENLIVASEGRSRRVKFNQTYVDEVNHEPDTCVEPQPPPIDCRENLCYNLLYRTMDGTCNNIDHPVWGAAYTQLKRLRRSAYDDDVQMPQGIIKKNRASGRDASRNLLSSQEEKFSEEHSMFLMMWGQFLAHDITKTSKVFPNESCTFCFPDDGTHCMAMKIPVTDPDAFVFGCHHTFHWHDFIPTTVCCVKTTRSTPVCGTGEDVSAPREQFNENTAYIDASMVYGSSIDDMKRLREGSTGFLKTSKIDGKIYMPYNTSHCNETFCEYFFFAGDPRADLFMGLAALHTIFLREHNRIAKKLYELNPHWNGDRVYQEARKIVGAMTQAITYNDYLPRIFGHAEYDERIGRYSRYNPKTDASIANVFASASFRYGHGMIRRDYLRFTNDGFVHPQHGYTVNEAIFNSTKMVKEGGIDPILNGLMQANVRLPRGITKQLTRRLFGNTDLTVVNVERGREHGVPGYNTWRRYCGLTDARGFDDLHKEIPSQEIRTKLQLLYKDPDALDLYVGQFLEEPIRGGLVGPTIACIVSEQFRSLRDGDRFFYQNPGVFTSSQLQELEKTSLSRLLCDNSDGMTHVSKNAFDFNYFADFTKCSNLPKMDLTKWRD